MKIAALLVLAFLISYVLKVFVLGKEDLSVWSEMDLHVLHFHETCVGLMVLAGSFALYRGLGLAKTVALETADTDITINTICPSYIRTPLVEKQIAQQAAAHGMTTNEVIEQIMLEPMPKKAFITAEEVAGTIEFLLSPAARNITGQTITIDGGWTAR